MQENTTWQRSPNLPLGHVQAISFCVAVQIPPLHDVGEQSVA